VPPGGCRRSKSALTSLSRFWLIVLRAYLLVAVTLFVVRIVQIALRH
jgi:hypothetical protein